MAPATVPSPVQVVGYERDVGAGASLLLADGGSVRREPLTPGATLDFGLGARHCAGQIEEEGHVPCAAQATPYCERHVDRWVCARCTGTCLKDEMDCYDPHAIYLAAFAPATFKVGVTKRDRLATRLREQGADRGATIRTVANGRIAREQEAEIAAEVGDSVRVSEKLRGFGRGVDEDAWETLCERFGATDDRSLTYDLSLATPPTPETLARGTVRGTKGRVLVLDRAESTYGVDMRDLVGHELHDGAPDRDRQASLGAFG